MKSILSFFLLLNFLVFPQSQLKVVTYNIMGMKPGTDPSTRLHHIIQNLKIINPDIIGIQEINEALNSGGIDNQAKQIADSLSNYFGVAYNYYYSQTHLSWNNQYKEFVGIITKYPVEQQSYLQLATGVFPRRVVWNYINTPIGKINFFNTHLDYQSTAIRVTQAQQIIQFVNQQEASFPGIASILTGDFNDTPGSQPINLFVANSFVETWSQVNPTLSGYTMPSNSPTSKIDFIFKKDGGQLKIDSSVIIMNKPYFASSFCSDHLGIMNYFSLKPLNVDEDKLLNEGFELEQNYPNPFNPITKISYTIPEDGVVTLKIYSLIGEEVAKLVNQYQYAGKHDVDFLAKNLPNGVYFYEMRLGEFVSVKKLLLLK
ncbi:MAG: endonuclease/exonuclease/phosphatase family protein [Ignavibacteria bacterium]|nr:endonuclease/exonuclease/phosphatase family protein [Ignavibacteria bacterium]MDP3831736.1 endonuclease/exonuclease/phosphatase family protein [Ignavibacteriaceae bacterium]